MSGHNFEFIRRVRYSDVTVGDHVFYSRYLEFIEEARGEFFRHIGLPLSDLTKQNLQMPVVDLQVKYRAPAQYDDELTISVQLTSLTRLRMTFQYRIINQSARQLVKATILHACTGDSGRPRRMPAELHDLLAAALATRIQ